MAAGQFLYAQTRPTGLYPLPKPDPFNKQVFFVTPKPTSSGPGPKSQTQKSVQTQNHKSQNIHVIFLAITAFSCHPNGCQDLTNQSVQKIHQITNPRNFANPEIKLANLKIPVTKH